MITPPTPENEEARLRALHDYEILDTLPEKDFDDITMIASEVCQTPIALVSLVDEKRQWFKSHRGLDVSQTPREFAFCAFAILNPQEVMVVNNAHDDPRFIAHPLVDGDPHLNFYAGAPLVTPDGHTLGTLCVIDREPREISEEQTSTLQALANQVVSQLELRKALKQVRVSHAKLKRQNQELEQFAYIASHDLNEPLRTIDGLTSMLQTEYGDKLDEDGTTCLRYLLTGLVSNLLEYSRIGSNDGLNEIEAEVIVREVVEDLAGVILESGAHIEFQNLPKLYADRVELRILFQNLISNAIKYHKEDVLPKVVISCRATENDHWHFTVTDNGIGINPSYQRRIFVIFQRLHTHNQIKGTGIGLAHCKKIVETRGGRIWVESELDKGSQFHFTWPR